MIYEISYKIIFEITAFFWGPLWLYISWDLERKGDKYNFSIKYLGSLVTKSWEIKNFLTHQELPEHLLLNHDPQLEKNYHVLLGYDYRHKENIPFISIFLYTYHLLELFFVDILTLNFSKPVLMVGPFYVEILHLYPQCTYELAESWKHF